MGNGNPYYRFMHGTQYPETRKALESQKICASVGFVSPARLGNLSGKCGGTPLGYPDAISEKGLYISYRDSFLILVLRL